MKKSLVLILIILSVLTAFISGCKKAAPAAESTAEPAAESVESEVQESEDKYINDPILSYRGD